MPIPNYDLPDMRKALITLLAKSLKPQSKFYKADYETICTNVNRMTMKQLRESLARQAAIGEVTEQECRIHSQL